VEQLKSLSYAARLPVLAKYLGQLAMVMSALVAVPLLVSLYFAEYFLSIRYTVIVVGLLAAGAAAARLRASDKIQSNEALAITGLAFILSPLLLSYPLTASGIPYADALFEAISGVTTTGLSTLPSVMDKPHTFLFSRAWTQWYGGLGIVVLSVALLMGHEAATRRLLDPELSNESLAVATRIYARRVLQAYVLLTLIGIALVWWLVGDGFAATTHVLAAVSTGGFSSFDNSAAGFARWPARFAVIGLGLCGAVSLPVYYRARHKGWRQAVADVELRGLLATATVIGIVLTGLMIHFQGASWETLRQALFFTLSAQTTTGFASMPVVDLDNGSKVVMIVSMAIGGSLGSTAGGIKILRLLVLLRLFQLAVRRIAVPSHAVVQAQLGGRHLEDDDVLRALVLMALFGAVILLSWLPFVVAGYDPLDALFEVVSATATVGLSTGITNMGLSPWLKAILCVDMLAGRLEIVALLIVLYPGTWFGKRAETS
jgi:trk system potassium uptake protein TrkH